MDYKDDNFVQLLISIFLFKNEVYFQEVYFQFNNKNCETFTSYLYCVQ